MKFSFNRTIKSERGGAAIGFILIASAAITFYISQVTDFVKIFQGQKTKSTVQFNVDRFTQGTLNYTVYAIKERWCLTNDWGRDFDCGSGEMNAVVSNSKNLERLLWSKVTSDAIKDAYTEKYGTPMTQDPILDKISANVSISSLESLGVNHPLNLALDNKLKNCLSSVKIDIERKVMSGNIAQGDETTLLIQVQGVRNGSSSKACKLIDEEDSKVKAEVMFYPRTLNQYALIKAGDFDLGKYRGSKSSSGLQFKGGVYVENDIKTYSAGYSPVGFFNTVRIGGGKLLLDGSPFTPKTYGASTDRTNSDFTTFFGFKSGLLLEGEVDEGLSPLFGGTFTYPPNSLMDQCINRAKLKDNPFMTRDSRLFIKKNGPNYTLALSQENEFRTNKVFGMDGDYSIREKEAQGGWKPSMRTNYTSRKTDEYAQPIMKIVAYNTSTGEIMTEVALGRDTTVNVTPLADQDFLDEQKNFFSTSAYTYSGDEIDTYSNPNFPETKTAFDDLRSKCLNHILNKDYKHEMCKKSLTKSSFSGSQRRKVKRGIQETTNCNSKNDTPKASNPGGVSDKEICQGDHQQIVTASSKYQQEATNAVNAINNASNDMPAIQLATTDRLSNQVNLNISLYNKSAFNNPIFKNFNDIKFKLVVYDFATENEGDTETGLRTRNSHKPGPNNTDTSNENIISLKLNRYANGDIQDHTLYSIEGGEMDGKINSSSLPNGWAILRPESYNEPPKVNNNGSYQHSYPENGMTTLEAMDLDEKCAEATEEQKPEWDSSFTENTQFSWLVNITAPGITITDSSSVTPLPKYDFKASNSSDWDPYYYQGVPTRSIVKDCIVHSDVNFVFGFYVCENLIINARSTKLHLIGTFITKNLRVQSSAITKGVTFSSIWDPSAIKYLKNYKHLRRTSKPVGSDDCDFDKPGWHPDLTEEEIGDYKSCSPMKFIYQGMNNFNWTTVDPEIGVEAGATFTQTQSKIPNRYRRYTAQVLWMQ